MFSIRIPASALAALVLLAPETRGAEPRSWDQAAVAKLASDLAKACESLYEEYYNEEAGTDSAVGSAEGGDVFKLRFKLERIHDDAIGLAGRLAAGQGREKTLPYVEHLGELVADLGVILPRVFVQLPLQQRLEAARAIWVQLLPYYGITPPPSPAKQR
jgi:hypothetical protein